MFHGIIVHLNNDLPIVVDMDELPAPGDLMVRCTNVRTVDGKRPAFVHERGSTFILPLAIIRLIEVPELSHGSGLAVQADYEPGTSAVHESPVDEIDEEAEEDLLARIRQI